MKMRTGFVSNSSSSSFVIKKKNLTPLQIYSIHNHYAICVFLKNNNLLPDKKDYDLSYFRQSWDIKETDEEIYGDTTMDNFRMGEFLRFIGVPEEVINIERDNG